MSFEALIVASREWWFSLPLEFQFLLVLPFLVGIAGLVAEAGRQLQPSSSAASGGIARLPKWAWPAGIGTALAASLIAD